MRFAIDRLAAQYPITGSVENLEDGRVKIVVEGSAEVIEEFLESVRIHTPGIVREFSRYPSVASGEFTNFTILR
jgi:acylphosphatase